MNDKGISKQQFYISLLITIFIAILPAAVAYGAIINKVEQNTDDLQNIPLLNERLYECEQQNAVVNVKIDTLLEEIREIKTDIKEIKNSNYEE